MKYAAIKFSMVKESIASRFHAMEEVHMCAPFVQLFERKWTLVQFQRIAACGGQDILVVLEYG